MIPARVLRTGVRVALLLLAPALVVSAGGAGPQAAADTRSRAGTLVARTVPATQGARMAAEGRIAAADKFGRVRLPISNYLGLDRRFHVLDTRVSADRKVSLDRIVGSPSRAARGTPLTVGLRTERLVHWNFVDRGGREVPASRVSLLEMRSNTGEVVRFRGRDVVRPRWMAAGRTQQTPAGLVNKEQYWSVSRVVVDGGDVVNRGQQKFVPEESQEWTVSLLFYRVQVAGRDLLFGSLSGDGLELRRPDGTITRVPFVHGKATLPSLARGTYTARIYGPGASFSRPVSISKDQLLEIEVISPFDLGLIGVVIVMVALSLLIVGRRHHITRLSQRWRRRGGRFRRPVAMVAVLAFVLGSSVLTTLVATPAARAAPSVAAAPTGPPSFAYYYIWYQPTSWQRAKKDYPLLGRYSSDDPVVMNRHVAMAKAAGLTGFLVSWKGTNDLNARLDTLVRTAERQDFKLEIVYQGLDFQRRPLPVPQIAEDLRYLADRYADSPSFDTFSRPVVVITGTDQFTRRQLKRITDGVRGRLLVLSSAKNVAEYRRVAPVTDGDAYYWSSSDPTSALYARKLKEMSRAVHTDGGLWFAPASAGFDARLIGGRDVVPREGGETLRRSIDVARQSSPDALGVISWNEFSENSHIEPSQAHGGEELRALATSLGGRALVPKGLSTPDPLQRNTGLTGWGALIGLLLVGALLNLLIAMVRGRRNGARKEPERQAVLEPDARHPSRTP